jgi:P27 family predicted phage terminase small subunit
MPRAHQPPALKLLKGVADGRDSGGRKVKATPEFRRLAPTPPSWLSREAKAEWKRVVPELLRLEIVKAEDRAALASYCETWATFVEATRTVHTEGLTIEAKQGVLAHPAVGIARNAGRELRAWANQFGLTPSAENALQLPEVTDDGDNPFG